MGGAASSLYEHVSNQLRQLCGAIGLAPHAPLAGLRLLLDPISVRPLREPPAWPTDISDDHTPVEYSIAYDVGKPPALRILGETIARQASRRANLDTALQLVDTLAGRLDLALDRFHRVRPLFVDDDPQQDFSIWFALVHRPDHDPEVKIYFNPDVRGRQHAADLVREALRRLGRDAAYTTALEYAVRPGQLGDRDYFSFFALDLHAQPDARIKLYVAHEEADADDLVRAANAVPEVDSDLVRDFLALTCGTARLTRRPPLSGYDFTEAGGDRPSGYTLYLPIREYVDDDEQARDRVLAVLDRIGLDPGPVDRAIHAVAQRPLADGVGLIAHMSLRLHANRGPGVTVYLSSEAYGVTPPRTRVVTANRRSEV
jgi:DMATS type aromatic prenyltransferase